MTTPLPATFRSLLLAASAPLIACGVDSLQAQSKPVAPGQKRVETPQRAPAEQDVLDLIEALGAEGFRERQAAERALSQAGAKVLDALRAAADEHEDPEVRWRARRLITSLEGGGSDGKLQQREPGGAGGTERGRLESGKDGAGGKDGEDGVERRLETMVERLERALGRNPDPRSMRSLREQMRGLEDLVKELRSAQGLGGGALVLPEGLGGALDLRGFGEGEERRIEIGPDGVRVELKTTGENGEEETKVYEAEDMESFREKYPEVAEELGLGQMRMQLFDPDGKLKRFGGGNFFLRQGDQDGDLRQGLRFDLRGPRGLARIPGAPDVLRPDVLQPATPAAQGERLGVYVGSLHPAVRDYLDLGEAEGLMVDEVADEGLAKTMGIERKDIVLTINGKTIGSAIDVQETLRGIAKGETVEVVVLRKGERLTKSATKQFDAPEKVLRPRRQVR